MVLDLAYGEIVHGASPDQRKEIDEQLASLDEQLAGEREDKIVEITRASGKVVRISEARLAQIRRNAGASARMRTKK